MIAIIKILIFLFGCAFYYNLANTIIDCHMLNKHECVGFSSFIILSMPFFLIGETKGGIYMINYIIILYSMLMPWFVFSVVLPMSLISSIGKQQEEADKSLGNNVK